MRWTAVQHRPAPAPLAASSGGARSGGLVGGPHDASRVEQLGRDDRGLEVEQRQVFLVLAGDSPADDEQVRGEEHLHVGVVALEALGPLLPGQVLGGALAGGGPGLGVVPVDLQVPELGVGDQRSVDDDG